MSALKNKKAQGEVAMGLAALALVLLIGALSVFYFIVLKGNITKGETTPFVEREHVISTTDYLNNLLSTRDDFGLTYSELIENSIDNPDWNHPGGETFSNYFSNTILPKICTWLNSNLQENTHYFKISKEGAKLHSCGVPPIAKNFFIASQELPIENGKRIEVLLETWVL